MTRTRGRVLVVEDDLFNRNMYSRVLKGAGFEVSVACNGDDALSALRKNPVDLVVSDLRMPRMDGFGLLRAMRSDATLALIPVVVLTAMNDDAQRVRGFGLCADVYLTKPIQFEQLVREVEGAFLRASALRHADTVALSGRLDSVGPVVVLTLLGSLGKTGSLSFTRAATTATVQLRDGEPVQAQIQGSLTGEAAILAILNWTGGEFRFTEESVTSENTIRLSINDLLTKAARME